jgi:hypothetical protein
MGYEPTIRLGKSNIYLSRYGLAASTLRDVANAAMRRGGRKSWSVDDYNEGIAAFHQINPCPPGVTCDFCDPDRTWEDES